MSTHLQSRGSPSATYQLVTDRILEALRRGVVPWRKPWKGREQLPCNAVTKRPYHGINLLLLSLSTFADHRWLTMRQANEAGGQIKRGEKSTLVVFWKQFEIDSEQEETGSRKRTIPLLRYFLLFNVEQCVGLSVPPLETSARSADSRIASAERIVHAMPLPPRIVEGGAVASYQPGPDLVRMPRLSDFESAETYYATLFHELTHATGHASRLDRAGVTGTIEFGSCDYSREELIAELGSAFLCAESGIDNSTIGNAASYINGWLGALSHDPKAVVIAAGQAQKAADFVIGRATT